MTHPRHETQSRTTLVVFLTLLLGILAVSVWMTGPFLISMVTGGILALIARPVYNRALVFGLQPRLASGLITAGLLLVVVIPALLCLTLTVKQGIAVSKELIAHNLISLGSIISRVSEWTPFELLGISAEELDLKAREALEGIAKVGTKAILDLAGNIPNLLLQMILASIACFFYLMDGAAFRKWFTEKIPLDPDVRQNVVSSFKNTAIATIWATLAAGFAQSAVMFFSYLVLGLSGAFLAGGLTFIMAWIPFLGSYPVWVVGTVVLYSKGAIGKAIVMAILGLFTGILDNIVRPWVLQGRSDLHPLVSLVAIFGGMSMFGILGVFLGPIIIAVLIALLQIWPAVGQRFGLVKVIS